MQLLFKKIIKGLVLLAAIFPLSSCGTTADQDVYVDGNLKISMRNLYFESWGGNDIYTDKITDKFKVKIVPSSYSYNDWTQQVTSAVNANNLTDVFQFNVTQFNFGSSYKYWAEADITKPLPQDMSKWPNIQNVLNNTSDLEGLKINGRLYGLPIAKNIAKSSIDYSPFTYVYRRDWAKKWNVYQENDVYTWEQFEALVKAFHNNLYVATSGSKYAMADVEWGFPSLTNFYKDSPHCFSYDETSSKYVSNYATDSYLTGLDYSKSYVDKHYYGYDQYNSSNEGGARKAYCTSKCGILYENLSNKNYQAIRTSLQTANSGDTSFNIDDSSAILKIKGPDGKYALEGTDNWFSMTLFNSEISDNKMSVILDIIDYLLSDEGTKLAVYGLEGYDYTEDSAGNIALTENGWPMDDNGEYVEKSNGAKFLRYLVTLGGDYTSYDPLTNQTAYKVLSGWEDEMTKANTAGELRVVKEKSEVMWLSTEQKDQYESALLSSATSNVIKYCYGDLTKEDFVSSVTTGQWPKVLSEINTKLGH